MTYIIRPAVGKTDLNALVGLRRNAEEWLATQGIRQWTPDYDEYARNALSDAVQSGNAWVVERGCDAVATVTLSGPDVDFWEWLPEEDQANALYIQKMIVRRDLSGLSIGGGILNWAGVRAQLEGKKWIRVDVRRDNKRLHQYYLDNGFTHLRVYHASRRRTQSGWLAQRAAEVFSVSSVDLVEMGVASDTSSVDLRSVCHLTAETNPLNEVTGGISRGDGYNSCEGCTA